LKLETSGQPLKGPGSISSLRSFFFEDPSFFPYRTSTSCGSLPLSSVSLGYLYLLSQQLDLMATGKVSPIFFKRWLVIFKRVRFHVSELHPDLPPKNLRRLRIPSPIQGHTAFFFFSRAHVRLHFVDGCPRRRCAMFLFHRKANPSRFCLAAFVLCLRPPPFQKLIFLPLSCALLQGLSTYSFHRYLGLNRHSCLFANCPLAQRCPAQL